MANKAEIHKYKTYPESTKIQNIADEGIKEIKCLFCIITNMIKIQKYKNTKIQKYKIQKYKIQKHIPKVQQYKYK